MTDTFRDETLTRSNTAAPTVHPWHRLLRRLRIWREARATRHALDRLDDRMLKDIGLTRCDITARAYHLARDGEDGWRR